MKLSKILIVFLLISLLPLIGCSTKSEIQKEDIDISYLKEESQKIKEYYYEQITQMNLDSPLNMKSRMWVKNKQARGEFILENKEGEVLEIQGFIFKDGVGVTDKYEIKHQIHDELNGNPVLLTAYRVDLVDIRGYTFLNYLDKLGPEKAKIIDFANHNGQECLIIEPNLDGEEIMIDEIWVNIDYLVPVMIKNETITIEFINIKVGKGTVNNNELKIPQNATLI
ncbi:MAG TPA: hypothetical protein GX723_03850 [Thermoanaerobacterales bacterium]|nr:hypothetical protein [Thermoanaerobacterales bacterium]